VQQRHRLREDRERRLADRAAAEIESRRPGQAAELGVGQPRFRQPFPSPALRVARAHRADVEGV
jgi:hypothetical protein